LALVTGTNTPARHQFAAKVGGAENFLGLWFLNNHQPQAFLGVSRPKNQVRTERSIRLEAKRMESFTEARLRRRARAIQLTPRVFEV
jgi:hypothetical protein